MMTENPSDIEAVDEGASLVVYCRSWCGDCARARAWLDTHGIPYTEVDVDDDRDARAEAEAINDGHLHTPTFKLGDGVCVDFRPEKLKELLGMD